MHPRTFLLVGLATIAMIFGAGLALQQPAFRLAAPAPVAASGAPAATGTDREVEAANPGLERQAAGSAERCGPGLVYLAEAGICTHGADPAPPGLDADRPVESLGLRAANRRAASTACDGDGRTGPRIQIIYLRGTSQPSRYDETMVAPLRAYAADADRIVQDSAAATNGFRQVRFVHDANCAPTVLDVAVTDAQLNSFNGSVSALNARGYQRQDRIYLIFADTTAAGICGIATIWNDDRPGPQNWNNSGPGYARVDAGCWNGTVVAHELAHTFGGVQLSARNTTGGFHCTDENDILCYQDGYNSPKMRTVCPDDYFNALLDCNNDDYFHTAPAAGSYLARHWNAANNRFLIKGPNDRAGSTPFDATPPKVKVVVPKTVKPGKRVRITAHVTDPIGVSRVEFRMCRAKRCNWNAAKRLTATNSRPFRTSWKAPKRGTVTVIVRAVDRAGNARVTRKTITIKPAKPGKDKAGKARGKR